MIAFGRVIIDLNKMRRNLAIPKAVLIATLFFGAGLVLYHVPFVAEDYNFLAVALKDPHRSPVGIYSFARIPVATFFQAVFFGSGVWEHCQNGMYLAFFAVHALAFTLLFRRLIESAGLSDDKTPPVAYAFPLVAAVFAWYPNNYEIHFWALLALQAIGVLFIALSYRMRRPAATIAFTVTAFLMYETYIFLFVGFGTLLLLVGWGAQRLSNREMMIGLLKLAGRTLVAITLWFIIRKAGIALTGHIHPVPPEQAFSSILSNTKSVFRSLWLLHFYKANWALSAVQFAIIIALAAWLFIKCPLPRARLALLIALPTVAALPLSLLTYSAPRAYYGPNLLQASMLAFLTYIMAIKARRFWWVFPSFFFVVFAIQWTIILRLKDTNYQNLQKNEAPILAEMASCKEPCTLVLPSPDKGYDSDYVMPTFAWEPYYQRLRLLHFPKKAIEIKIGER